MGRTVSEAVMKEPNLLKGGAVFDQAHSEKMIAILDSANPPIQGEARAFALFCAGIVDSVFHKVKTDNPKAVSDMKGFGIRR